MRHNIGHSTLHQCLFKWNDGMVLKYFSKKYILSAGRFFFTKMFEYSKIASSNMSRLEAHAGFFSSLMKGIFDPLVL